VEVNKEIKMGEWDGYFRGLLGGKACKVEIKSGKEEGGGGNNEGEIGIGGGKEGNEKVEERKCSW
jgi:hypothetical protein